MYGFFFIYNWVNAWLHNILDSTTIHPTKNLPMLPHGYLFAYKDTKINSFSLNFKVAYAKDSHVLEATSKTKGRYWTFQCTYMWTFQEVYTAMTFQLKKFITNSIKLWKNKSRWNKCHFYLFFKEDLLNNVMRYVIPLLNWLAFKEMLLAPPILN